MYININIIYIVRGRCGTIGYVAPEILKSTTDTNNNDNNNNNNSTKEKDSKGYGCNTDIFSVIYIYNIYI